MVNPSSLWFFMDPEHISVHIISLSSTHFSETPLADDLQVVEVGGFYPAGRQKKRAN